MILYIKDPNDSNKKFLDLINTSSKVAIYNIKQWKAVSFLCTNEKHTKKEFRGAIPLTIVSNKPWNKYDWGSERLVNLKTLMKEIEKTPEDGKISCGHGMIRLILWKWYPTKTNLWTQFNSPSYHNCNTIIYDNWKKA